MLILNFSCSHCENDIRNIKGVCISPDISYPQSLKNLNYISYRGIYVIYCPQNALFVLTH